MNERSRLLLALSLCWLIFSVWQMVMPPTPAPVAAVDANVLVVPPPMQATQQDVDALPTQHWVAESRSERDAVLIETPLWYGHLREDGSWRDFFLSQFADRHAHEPNRAIGLFLPNLGQVNFNWLTGGAPLQWERRGDTTMLGRTSQGLLVDVTMTVRAGTYLLDYVINISNTSSSPQTWGLALGLGLADDQEHNDSGFLPRRPSPLPLQAFCSDRKGFERKEAGRLKMGYQSNLDGLLVGIDKQYFVVASSLQPDVLPIAPKAQFGYQHNRLLVHQVLPETSLAAGAHRRIALTLFIGPKRYEELRLVAGHLEKVIDYDFLKIPLSGLAQAMNQLLRVFFSWTHNWGIAIAMLTLFVKTLVLPVFWLSHQSSRRMMLLKPELDAIKARYKQDPERAQLEQLRLFREKKVNPLGGCLPNLLQIPLWYVLYRLLQNAVDLYQQPFAWIGDLTAQEPYPVLAVLTALLTFLQQKITPLPSMDPVQAQTMTVLLPVMIGIFMLPLPSGLVLYFLVNTILTILQQFVMNRFFSQESTHATGRHPLNVTLPR